MEEESEGRHVILPRPDHSNDQVKTIVRLLSAVLDSEQKWPDGKNDFFNHLEQMKIALDDLSFQDQQGEFMMIDTASKT